MTCKFFLVNTKQMSMTCLIDFTKVQCKVYIVRKNVVNICHFERKCIIILPTMYTLLSIFM